MSNNMFDDVNNNDFFVKGGNQEENIDLNSLIKTKTNNVSNVPEEPVSPLEQMKKQNESRNMGTVVSNEDLQERKLKDPIIEDSQRVNEMEQRVNEIDDSIEKRKAIVVIKEPTNGVEYTQLMIELDSVNIHPDGTATIDYFNKNGEPIKPSFIRLREDGDPAFDLENDKQQMEKFDSVKDQSVDTSENNNGSEDELNNIVKVIIDKTGLGTDFIFNEDEKKKLYEASEIHLSEVSILDINTINAKRSEKSFQESINEYQLSNSRTTICFPASGFRAQMKGLTYGEMGDVALSMEAVTVDQYYKRLSIIYNKMCNISTGPFKSFEDFLKNFAYVDIPIALYGLYISTNPEVQQIQLKCGKAGCEKTFNWEFGTRSVLRLEKCSRPFLDKMKEIATSPAIEYDNIHNRSAVKNSKYIELPYSKFVIEMGIISSYEFLYNFIPVLDEDTFKSAFGDDLNQIYMNNVLLLTTVRSVRIPNSDGTYTVCEGYKDILDAIYNINPEEIKILSAVSNKLTSEYQSYFSFGDVVCPHCGNVTHDLDLSMDDLVFQTYQRLLSTEINVENIRGF